MTRRLISLRGLPFGGGAGAWPDDSEAAGPLAEISECLRFAIMLTERERSFGRGDQKKKSGRAERSAVELFRSAVVARLSVCGVQGSLDTILAFSLFAIHELSLTVYHVIRDDHEELEITYRRKQARFPKPS